MNILPAPWSTRAYLCCGVLILGIVYTLFHVPFGVSDNFTILLALFESRSAGALFVSNVNLQGFMRPMMWSASKVIFDASAGHYFVAYRALHAVLIATILFGIVRLTRVSSRTTFALALVSLAAAIGFGPFHEAVRETELNTKLLITALTFAVVLMADSEPRRWKDAAAVIISAFALLTIELGLLTWVCLVIGFAVGFRGISRGAILAVTAAVGAYLCLRFLYYDVGLPGLFERSSGLGLRVLEPPELMRMFGERRWPFYAYNVMASAMAVLFSEPQSGVFAGVLAATEGALTPGILLNVITSTATTGVLIWFGFRRWSAWKAREFTRDDRLFILGAAVVMANAAISFPYAKNVTMSTAAAFYVLPMFAALRHLTSELTDRPQPTWRAASMLVLLTVISVGWALRGMTFYLDMRREAEIVRRDWATVDDFLDKQGMTPETVESVEFVETFKSEMLALPPPRGFLDRSRFIRSLDPH